MPLAPAHFKDLRKSGLNDDTIAAMIVSSVPTSELSKLSPRLNSCGALKFAYFRTDFDGRYRLDHPIDGMRYWQPPGSGTHLYILPAVAEIIANPTIDIAITEGEKKAACLTQNGIPTIGIAGIWCWTKPKTCELHEEFTDVAFVERNVLIAFDSDTWTRPDIQQALYALGKAVEAQGAHVEAVIIPPAADGAKQGADDFIATNGIGKFKELKRIKLKHDGLAQHKSWFEQWRAKKQPSTKTSSMVLIEPEPWADPVNGDKLIRDICETHGRFVDATTAQGIAIALWCIHAHATEYFDISPFLIMTSATMRSGKTTTIQVIERLVPKPLLASNISSAAFYRAIEAYQPTIILDEFEYIVENVPELRGILNSSHTRRTAYVLRTDGDDHEPRRFSTWCPKCFGLIGKMPPTAADRSIEVRMRRKIRSIRKESFKLANNYDDIEIIRRKICRWVKDNADAIRTANPPVLDQLDDRANDNWAPLFKIADVLGGAWLGHAQAAALEINKVKADDSIAIQLLSDIHTIVKDTDKISTKMLVEELVELEDRPWATYNRGKAISYRQVAKHLNAFDVPTNRTVRLGDDTAKGFETAWFQDAFARYLAADSDSNRSHRSQPNETTSLEGIFDQSQTESVTDRKSNLNGGKECVVTDVTEKKGGGTWEEV